MLCRTIAITVLLMTTHGIAQAEVRCGEARPIKEVAEKTTANIKTQAFLDHISTSFDQKFKGYAVILTGAHGARLGFRREGWAIDPCESNAPSARFDLNTETAIGSVTKLFTTVAVLKATNDHLRLQRPLTDFLPFRWRKIAHSFYDTVSIEELLQHKGGFFKSGGGKHVTERLAGGRERSLGDFKAQPRSYSNSSMGIFHFIYAKYAFQSTSFLNPMGLHDVEVKHQNSNDSKYNAEVQKVTSAAFNHGLYRHILKPLGISATCDARVAKFPASNTIKSPPNAPIVHFPFFTVAQSYASPADNRGILLPTSMQNCAAGGLYMSAKDLAAFVFSLGDPDFLPVAHQKRMMNDGPVNDLYAFGTIGATGGRAFWHNGKRTVNGNASYAVIIRFASGASAVFVTNSNNDGTNTLNTIRDAYDLARN